MKDDYLVFGKPSIQKEEIDEVVDSLKSNWLGTGPKVKRFESQFAEYKKIAAGLIVFCQYQLSLKYKMNDFLLLLFYE